MNILWRRLLTPYVGWPLGLALFGITLLATFASSNAQWAFLAVLMALLLAVLLPLAASWWAVSGQSELLQLALTLASNSQLKEHSQRLAAALRQIADQVDPISRELAIARVGQIEHDLSEIAQGRFLYLGTETWRMPYERLLRSPGLYRYRSVALIRTANYWQDEPGRQSTKLNCEIAGSGKVEIERIVLVADALWPMRDRLPVEPIHSWLCTQSQHGIKLKLIRQSVLDSEPDLVADLGIYGNRAVGHQEIDERGRTVRFTLAFDLMELLAAEERWRRLSLYAVSLQEILDQGDNED
jgi:hypothetical protein